MATDGSHPFEVSTTCWVFPCLMNLFLSVFHLSVSHLQGSADEEPTKRGARWNGSRFLQTAGKPVSSFFGRTPRGPLQRGWAATANPLPPLPKSVSYSIQRNSRAFRHKTVSQQPDVKLKWLPAPGIALLVTAAIDVGPPTQNSTHPRTVTPSLIESSPTIIIYHPTIFPAGLVNFVGLPLFSRGWEDQFAVSPNSYPISGNLEEHSLLAHGQGVSKPPSFSFL